jgi:uncharacterized repeat protein (TIGR01451 family)
MNPTHALIRVLSLALLLAVPLVGAVGARAHGGGTHLQQIDWRTFDSLSLLGDSSASAGCTPAARAQQLRDAQREVLQLLRPTPGVDLTTLRDETDLAGLAALGYNVYAHQMVSFEGMGWGALDGLAPQDPREGKPVASRPTELAYAPTPPTPPLTVTEPKDGFDFPYHLAGWIYIFPFDFEQHPITGGDDHSFLSCLERREWFVHERGIHPFETGGMMPMPPPEDVHGTAPGSDDPTELMPGDLPHKRLWDLHVWLDGDDVPTVQMLNPGAPIPGIDPGVGPSPPPSWPNPPFPGFYYPGQATDLAVALADSPDPVAVGSDITYTITLHNAGPNVATNVQLSDDVPANTTLVSLDQTSGPSASCTTAPLACTIASLDVGASASLQLVVKVGGGVAPGTTITNEAAVASASGDQRSANNTALAETATTGPTAIRLRSFAAEASARGPLIRWSTASELGTLGFNLFRQQRGKRIRLNASQIAARGGPAGSTYSYRDRGARSALEPLRYWLQAIHVSASPVWYGPVRVTPKP